MRAETLAQRAAIGSNMLDKPSDKPSDRPPANSRDTAAKSDFENLHEIVAKAKQNLNQNNWDYIVGGTESETTLRRNRLALDSARFGRACSLT